MKYGLMPDYFHKDSVDNSVINAFAKTLLDLGSPDDVFGILDDAYNTGEDVEIAHKEWFGHRI